MERLKEKKNVRHRIRQKLRERGGGTVIDIAALFLVGLLILFVVSEYLRIQITANNIKDSYERSILTVAIDNYNEVYAGVREMKEVGGEYQGGPGDGEDPGTTPEWVALNDYGNVQEELEELLNLEMEDNSTTLYSPNEKYRLSDMEVMVRNAEDTERQKYEIKGRLNASIPIYLGSIHITDVNIPIKITTAYTAKY